MTTLTSPRGTAAGRRGTTAASGAPVGRLSTASSLPPNVPARAAPPSSAPMPVAQAPAPSAGSRVIVAVRVRPINKADGERPEITVNADPATGEIQVQRRTGERPKSYQFDHVFTSNQQTVYEAIGRPMLVEGFNGYNTCLFAYGQTGSGKTYSIQGDSRPVISENAGLLPRFVYDMLEHVRKKEEEDPDLTIKVQMSYLEIYNEKVRDLLAPRRGRDEPQSLEIREARDDRGRQRVYVDGLQRHTVTALQRIHQLVDVGNSCRQTSETNMNEFSSRSHSVIQFYVTQQYDPPAVEKPNLESVMSLVDLAGSERQSKTGAEGARFAESKAINQSLLMLGRALNAFADGSTSFVPLRDSKLTRLLSECFGGNAKTWMLATVSPAGFNLQESVSTLDYASNAKFIVNSAEINRQHRQLELSQLRTQNEHLLSMVNDQSGELGRLKSELQRLRDDNERLFQAAKEQQRGSNGSAVGDVATRMEIERLNRELAELRAAAKRNEAAASSRFGGVATYVGRAKVSLRNIIEQTSNFMTLPLFSDDSSGDAPFSGPQPLLIVNIYPVDQNGLSQLDGRSEKKTVQALIGTRVDFVVHVIRAKEIPARFAHTVYCKYVYKWAEKDSYRTSDGHDRTDPEWDFKKRFAFSRLNAGLVEYFMSDNVITFEVIGEARGPDVQCTGCDQMMATEKERIARLNAAR